MITTLQALAITLFTWGIWRLFQRYRGQSDLNNIPGPASVSFWTGSFHQIFNPSGWDFHKAIALKFGSIIRINAFLGAKMLYVFDPKAMHHILVKDQYIYEETSAFIENNRIVFGEGLLSTLGEQHRKQRKMLNPVFSIAHMRQMVPIFYDVSNKLVNAVESRVKSTVEDIDMLEWMTRTALELIGQSGLGYSFDPLNDNAPQHPYSKSAKQLVPVGFRLFFLRIYVLPVVARWGPPWFRRTVVNMLPLKNLHRMRDIVDVMHKTSLEIIEQKWKALADGDEAVSHQIGHGKDIISILMRANMEASEEDKLTDDEVLGQMSSLIFAAMDTTSTALSRTLWLLSQYPEVQEKLRQELKEAKGENMELSYDQLTSLPFLDAVCRETLRLYPPVSSVMRTARQDMILPLSNPVHGIDGREMHEIHVPKNTDIIVSILSSNRNPDIWGPDSFEWNPERWLKSLPDSVAEAHLPGIYSHLMTFIGGSRACIGFKFSQLEMKVVLAVLLEKFRFAPSGEIVWAMNGITTPYAKGATIPSLPLKVSLV